MTAAKMPRICASSSLPSFSRSTMWYSISSRMAATCAGVRRSVLPISMKRPPSVRQRMLLSASSPVRKLRTTCTPCPPVALRTRDSKAVEREEKTCSIPMERSRARLRSVPAVARMTAPRALAIWMAARPTPPVAECSNTRSPGWRRAAWTSACQAVMKTVGITAASVNGMPSGMEAAKASRA